MDRRDAAIHFTRATALVGAVGAVCFFAAAVASQLLHADHDALANFVSDLAVGEQGGLMTTSFWLHGTAIVAVSLGLNRGVAPSRSHVASSLLIGLGGFGVLMLGFFPTDLAGEPRTLSGAVHLVVAGTSFGSLSLAFLLFAHAVRHDVHWHSFRPYALGLGWSATAALAAFAVAITLHGVGVTRTTHYLGLLERVLIGTILAWILATAVRLRSVACAGDHFVHDGDRVRVQ